MTWSAVLRRWAGMEASNSIHIWELNTSDKYKRKQKTEHTENVERWVLYNCYTKLSCIFLSMLIINKSGFTIFSSTKIVHAKDKTEGRRSQTFTQGTDGLKHSHRAQIVPNVLTGHRWSQTFWQNTNGPKRSDRVQMVPNIHTEHRWSPTFWQGTDGPKRSDRAHMVPNVLTGHKWSQTCWQGTDGPKHSHRAQMVPAP